MGVRDRLLLSLGQLNFFYPDRLGPGYVSYRSFLAKFYHGYDPSDRLLSVVNSAIESVPYYMRLEVGRLSSISEFESRVGFVDKDTVMERHSDFLLPRTPERKIIRGTTGGTSGKPLDLVIPRDRYIVELNTIHSMWRNAGWNGQFRAVLRNSQLGGDLCRVDPVQKQVIFDGFNVTPEYYERVYNFMRLHGIGFIHAYPSSAYQFSLFLKKTGKDVSFIKAFLCGSEGATSIQRALIGTDLGIPLYNWYGHSEKLVLGGPCAHNSAIHVEPTYGYFELIDDRGSVIREPGRTGEIVGTTLHNPYMPLIRYRTGDYAQYVGDYCEGCGRRLPLITGVQGRWDRNRIFLNDGSYATITALNLHSDLYRRIEGMQYIQRARGLLDILLVKGQGFDDVVEAAFKAHFDAAFRGKCDYHLVYVDAIDKEPNGKFLPLKQYLED